MGRRVTASLAEVRHIIFTSYAYPITRELLSLLCGGANQMNALYFQNKSYAFGSVPSLRVFAKAGLAAFGTFFIVTLSSAAEHCDCGRNIKYGFFSCAREVASLRTPGQDNEQADAFSIVALPSCLDPNNELLLVSLRNRAKAFVINVRTSARSEIEGDPAWESANNWVFAGLHDFEFYKKSESSEEECGAVFYSFVGTNSDQQRTKSLRIASARLERTQSGQWKMSQIRRLITIDNKNSGTDPYSLFGSRLMYVPEGSPLEGLYVSVGDHYSSGRYDLPQNAQNMETYIGKLLRIQKPFSEATRVEILASGLRDPQGLALTPEGIFLSDHGPNGGDEVNRFLQLDENYGWPRCSNGMTYTDPPEDLPIPQDCEGVARPYLDLPVGEPRRSGENFAPSGMHYYTAKGMKNDIQSLSKALLITSLTNHGILLLRTETGDRVPLFENGAFRDLTQTEDGKLFAVTDNRMTDLVNTTGAAKICRITKEER